MHRCTYLKICSFAAPEPHVQQLLRPAASSGGAWIRCGGGAQDPRKPRNTQPVRGSTGLRQGAVDITGLHKSSKVSALVGDQEMRDRHRKMASEAARPPWVTTVGWASTRVLDAKNVGAESGAGGGAQPAAHETGQGVLVKEH